MTITRVGSTQKFAAGWEKAFQNKKKATKEKPARKAPAKAKKSNKK